MLKGGGRQQLLELLLKQPNQYDAKSMNHRRSTQDMWQKELRIRRKEDEANRLIKSSQKLPSLPTFKERLDRLRDWDYTGSDRHQALIWYLPVEGVHPNLYAFEARFIRIACDGAIPVHAAARRPSGVQIWQSQWRDLLPDEDWEVIEQLGYWAARSLMLEVKWMGSKSQGWWTVHCPEDQDGNPVCSIRDWRMPNSLRVPQKQDRDAFNEELDAKMSNPLD